MEFIADEGKNSSNNDIMKSRTREKITAFAYEPVR